jgi:hypothetical protein
MMAIGLAQSSISYTFAFGTLGIPLKLHLTALTTLGALARWGLLMSMAALWLLEKKGALFVLVIVVNTFATLILFLHAGFLASVLAGLSARTIKELLIDVALMAVSNVLIFSVWYWVLDPPGIDNEHQSSEQWAFLFTQRASELPGFAGWQPHYADYLFVAFTTSLAFSPTDTLPLTRSAKMLMLLQAVISVITLTGIAGSAINILAGTASAGR